MASTKVIAQKVATIFPGKKQVAGKPQVGFLEDSPNEKPEKTDPAPMPNSSEKPEKNRRSNGGQRRASARGGANGST